MRRRGIRQEVRALLRRGLIFCFIGQDKLCGWFGKVFTFGNDEGMAFGEWANVEKGVSKTGEC